MIIIWGTKTYSKKIGIISRACPICGGHGFGLTVYRIRKRLTLYYIPTFILSEKPFLACDQCRVFFPVPNGQVRLLQSMLDSADALYRPFLGAADEIPDPETIAFTPVEGNWSQTVREIDLDSLMDSNYVLQQRAFRAINEFLQR